MQDEIPVLVLQNDRHLFGILRAQILRQFHAGIAAAEADVEMMRAREARFRDLSQHASHDAAQRIVDESVVVKAIVHGLSEIS